MALSTVEDVHKLNKSSGHLVHVHKVNIAISYSKTVLCVPDWPIIFHHFLQNQEATCPRLHRCFLRLNLAYGNNVSGKCFTLWESLFLSCDPFLSTDQMNFGIYHIILVYTKICSREKSTHFITRRSWKLLAIDRNTAKTDVCAVALCSLLTYLQQITGWFLWYSLFVVLSSSNSHL